MPTLLTRSIRRAALVALGLALLLTLVLSPPALARPRPDGPRPSIVLVHGAFADASGFALVTARLQHDGYTVYAPPNPLRGLDSDAASLRTFLTTIPGPVVVVGHSHGGAVITDATTGLPNVKALVYLAAYALDEGESAVQANQLGGGAPPLLLDHLVTRPYPGSGTDVDLTIDPAWYRAVFAADLPARRTRVMATSQRPVAFSALTAPSAVPGWRSIPSWYVVATHDNAIPPAAERAMAARAGARTTVVDSSHAVMTGHPRLVAAVIDQAARRVS